MGSRALLSSKGPCSSHNLGLQDALAKILQTADRNLALLVGRALDAQGLLHHVTYSYRLRDTSNELYTFGNLHPMPLSPTKGPQSARYQGTLHLNGVFTLLTDCYSPTCSREAPCYSVTCPRRLEQQTRASMSPPMVAARESKTAYDDTSSSLALLPMNPPSAVVRAETEFEKSQKLWSTFVPPEIVAMVSEAERKRQEAIFEVIQKEAKYVDDLDLVHRVGLMPTIFCLVSVPVPTGLAQFSLSCTFNRYVFQTLSTKLVLNASSGMCSSTLVRSTRSI